MLREAGCRARILLGEANTFPFAARCVGAASAVIYGAKAEVLAAALPAMKALADVHQRELDTAAGQAR